MLPGRNKVPCRIKQGGRPDSAHRPCVCHLGRRGSQGTPSVQCGGSGWEATGVRCHEAAEQAEGHRLQRSKAGQKLGNLWLALLALSNMAQSDSSLV